MKNAAVSKGWRMRILFLAAILPALLCLGYVLFFGVNVPYNDQWDFVPLLGKMHSGSLSFSDLFAQHNEHRLLFPRIAMLALASLTGYNVVAEMLFSLVLAALIAYFLWRIYCESFGASPSAMPWFIPIVWLAFSFRQFENLLWGWQLQIFMCVLGFIASVYLLGKADKPANLLLAALCAAISTFSFFNGLLAWPAGLAAILLSRNKAKNSAAAFWLIAGLLAYAAFFYGWQRPPSHPSLSYGLENPLTAIAYFLTNTGAPFTFLWFSLAAGAVFVPLMLVIAKFAAEEKAFSRNPQWVALILFALGSSLVLTIGRSGFGIAQAYTSRYVTFAYLGVVGLYALSLGMKGSHRSAWKILLAMIIVGLLIGYSGGVLAGMNTMHDRSQMKDSLENYKSVPDAQLAKLHPNATLVREGAQTLESLNLSIFRK